MGIEAEDHNTDADTTTKAVVTVETNINIITAIDARVHAAVRHHAANHLVSHQRKTKF
jgi:hypothetical protein